VPAVFFVGVYGEFGGRQGEDEPVVADVEGGEAQDVAQERAIGLGVAAENNYVGPKIIRLFPLVAFVRYEAKLPLAVRADTRSARRRRQHTPTRSGASKYE